jgi:hypothetical protein
MKMNLTNQIAAHIRDIHFGGNWTDVDMQMVLKDVTFEEATDSSTPFNSIALLVFHCNFYLRIVHKRLMGDTTTRFKQEDSFVTEPPASGAEWQALLQQTWADAEAFATTVEQSPEARMWEEISKGNGSFYKNIHGVVEHNHYHLGQMVLVKKLLRGRV